MVQDQIIVRFSIKPHSQNNHDENDETAKIRSNCVQHEKEEEKENEEAKHIEPYVLNHCTLRNLTFLLLLFIRKYVAKPWILTLLASAFYVFTG